MRPHPPHRSVEALQARALARSRQRQRRERTRLIRRRVLSATLGLFVASWAVIGVQLASGHDPALVHDARLRPATVAPVAPAVDPTPASTTRPADQVQQTVTPAATPAAPTPSQTTVTPAQVAPTPAPVITRQS